MNFDHVERRERTFDSRDAAAEGQHRVIDTSNAERSDIETTPVAGNRLSLIIVVIGVERTTGAVTIVPLGRHHHVQALASLGRDLPAKRRLDARSFQLDDRTRVDSQAGFRSAAHNPVTGGVQRAA